jgi:hypothetical protein
MTPESISRIVLATGLLFAASPARLSGQTSGLGASLVLRSQAASVAEEAVSRLGNSLNGIDRVGLVVEGGSAPLFVENAFLDFLNRRGVHMVLTGGPASPKEVIQVSVLDQSVRYSSLPSGEFRREVQTAVEARRAFADSSSMEYLGLFKKLDIDTVAFREEIGMTAVGREGERSLFDRLLGPVLLIGGAFLIVYLFFTVRN